MLYSLATALSAAFVINAPVAPIVEIRQAVSPAIVQNQPVTSSIFPTSLVTADMLDDFADQEAKRDAAIEAKVRV